VALERGEGVVKRRSFFAMLSSTTPLPKGGAVDLAAKVLISSTLHIIPFSRVPFRVILSFKFANR
jgi:hypothetical protein